MNLGVGNLKKMDFVIAIAVMIMAIAGMAAMKSSGQNNGQKHVEIWSDGQLYKKIDINEGYSEKIKVEHENGYNIVYIHDGGAQVIEADCNDKVCVDMGLIENDGEIIACLPHKMYVKIVSNTENEVDAISQ